MRNKFSSLLLVSALALGACSSEPELPMLNEGPQQDVQAQAAKTIKLNMVKANTPEPKSNSPLKNKLSRGEVKKAEKLEITFEAPSTKNAIDSKSTMALARFALKSMNAAKDYESGCKKVIPTLQKLASEGNLIAKLGLDTSNASGYWGTRFKVSAIALRQISESYDSTPMMAGELAKQMLSTTEHYEDGSKIGYAALDVLGSINNQDANLIINTVRNSAKQGKYWEDVYKAIYNGLVEIKSFLPNN